MGREGPPPPFGAQRSRLVPSEEPRHLPLSLIRKKKKESPHVAGSSRPNAVWCLRDPSGAVGPVGQGFKALKINGRRGLAGGWTPLKEDRRLCGGLLKELPQGLCLLVRPVSCKSSGTKGKSRLVASQRDLSILGLQVKTVSSLFSVLAFS